MKNFYKIGSENSGKFIYFGCDVTPKPREVRSCDAIPQKDGVRRDTTAGLCRLESDIAVRRECIYTVKPNDSITKIMPTLLQDPELVAILEQNGFESPSAKDWKKIVPYLYQEYNGAKHTIGVGGFLRCGAKIGFLNDPAVCAQKSQPQKKQQEKPRSQKGGGCEKDNLCGGKQEYPLRFNGKWGKNVWDGVDNGMMSQEISDIQDFRRPNQRGVIAMRKRGATNAEVSACYPNQHNPKQTAVAIAVAGAVIGGAVSGGGGGPGGVIGSKGAGGAGIPGIL